MPATPQSEEFPDNVDVVDSSAAPRVTEPPRTLKNRAARAAVQVETSAPAAPDSAVQGEPAPAESMQAESVQSEPAQVAPAATETANAEAPQAASPRTGRIEVPVPSVVRARERAEIAAGNPVVLRAESLTKSYGQVLAAADVSFEVHAGSLTGVVGPNGAGKTTVLSMITGLNRPSSGRISVHDIDVWGKGPAAKRVIGSLPDRLRLFDRLTGGQLLYYAGVLQGLDQATVAKRAAELATAFGLESALDRPVSDYSAGMQKKIGLACSMIHAPEVLVLDEPYETIDPVSASNVTEILEKYVAGGGSVIMSSHSLDLIQRICDHVVIIVDGSVVAQGTVDAVRDGVSLEERFKHLTNPDDEGKGLEWLRGSSDSE
ncbi:MAG: ATP-binding cassette domain-containing protein [Actinobacteria bacterium]|nr:ATP-binding cassette domain-containing protein [Actinomycetota bacterium]